jgi:hypothetical protein
LPVTVRRSTRSEPLGTARNRSGRVVTGAQLARTPLPRGDTGYLWARRPDTSADAFGELSRGVVRCRGEPVLRELTTLAIGSCRRLAVRPLLGVGYLCDVVRDDQGCLCEFGCSVVGEGCHTGIVPEKHSLTSRARRERVSSGRTRFPRVDVALGRDLRARERDEHPLQRFLDRVEDLRLGFREFLEHQVEFREGGLEIRSMLRADGGTDGRLALDARYRRDRAEVDVGHLDGRLIIGLGPSTPSDHESTTAVIPTAAAVASAVAPTTSLAALWKAWKVSCACRCARMKSSAQSSIRSRRRSFRSCDVVTYAVTIVPMANPLARLAMVLKSMSVTLTRGDVAELPLGALRAEHVQLAHPV